MAKPEDGRVKRVKVAVIGTGLAGLSTAYFLSENGSGASFEVHLFEKSDSLGMDSSSISIKTADGTFRVDSPMRSINGGSHDAVWQLYRELGIELRKSDFSYSFSRLSNSLTIPHPPPPPTLCPPSAPPPYHATQDSECEERPERPAQLPVFIYEGSNGFKFPPLAIPSTLSWLQSGPYLIHMLLLSLAYLHLLALAFFYTRTGVSRAHNRGLFASALVTLGVRNVGNEPLGDFTRRHWIWRGLREEVLEPLVAAVCTVGRDEVGDLPTEEVLSYITSTFGSSHFVAARGVQQVVAALAAPIPDDRIHLSTTITDISPTPSSPSQKRLSFTSAAGETKSADFDQVVFATQANHAQVLLRMYQAHLEDSKAEKDEQERIEALGAFEYVPSLVVTHWDESMLPSNPCDRRDLNLASFATSLATARATAFGPPKSVSKGHTVTRTSVQATHIISRTHPALTAALPRGTALLQTTNPIVPVDPSLVLSEAWYERAKVSVAGKRVLPRFLIPKVAREGEGGDLQGARGIYFVGSWCAEGLPLLEGCVTSARSAVSAIRSKYN